MWTPFAASRCNYLKLAEKQSLLSTYLRLLLTAHNTAVAYRGVVCVEWEELCSFINQTYYVEMGLLARLGQSKQFYWN